MANKIYIKPIFDTKKVGDKSTDFTPISEQVMVFPLTEDITFNVSSDLQSWSDMIPGIELLGKMQAIKSGPSGTLSEGVLNLQNMFDAPRWDKTNPIEFTVNLGFYLINDAYKNIYAPMKTLIGYSILSRRKADDKIVPPGLFLPAAAVTRLGKKGKGKGKGIISSAKLVSIKIPGIITMQYAMIKQATPVFSKHITESGYPLWGTLELTITGLTPAFDTDFNGEPIIDYDIGGI